MNQTREHCNLIAVTYYSYFDLINQIMVLAFRPAVVDMTAKQVKKYGC